MGCTMSDQICGAVSDIGLQCTRSAGHEKPKEGQVYSPKANTVHIAATEDGVALQVWKGHA